MPDIAIIEKRANLGGGLLQLVGVFTDGATFKTPFDVQVRARSREDVRRALANALADSRSGFDIEKLIPAGEFDLTPPTVEEPEPPAKEESERRAWQAKADRVANLRQYLSADHAELAKLQAEVNDEFNVEFA